MRCGSVVVARVRWGAGRFCPGPSGLSGAPGCGVRPQTPDGLDVRVRRCPPGGVRAVVLLGWRGPPGSPPRGRQSERRCPDSGTPPPVPCGGDPAPHAHGVRGPVPGAGGHPPPGGRKKLPGACRAEHRRQAGAERSDPGGQRSGVCTPGCRRSLPVGFSSFRRTGVVHDPRRGGGLWSSLRPPGAVGFLFPLAGVGPRPGARAVTARRGVQGRPRRGPADDRPHSTCAFGLPAPRR